MFQESGPTEKKILIQEQFYLANKQQSLEYGNDSLCFLSFLCVHVEKCMIGG